MIASRRQREVFQELKKEYFRLGVIVFLILTFSAVLAHWIVKNEEDVRENKEINDHRVELDQIKNTGVLEENNFYYCPVCGTMIQLDRSPLSMQPMNPYRRHAHETVSRENPNAFPELGHDDRSNNVSIDQNDN